MPLPATENIQNAWSSAESAGGLDESALEIDCEAAAAEIEQALRGIVSRTLHRRGAVVGVSGGIDSAVCAALAARALGPQRVLALLLPERESPPSSLALGRTLCEKFSIPYAVEDITSSLEALECYQRRDDAIRTIFPSFRSGGRFKIAVADHMLETDRVNYFNLIAEIDGQQQSARLPLDAYLDIVAATNMKQRLRKLLEYTHADRLNYAVMGTPNRLEYDQGFFVRGGDGLADVKPIAHLYKTQVYALARHLGVPDQIVAQMPTTGTYSLPQTQQEFFFGLPLPMMDRLLHAYANRMPVEDVASALNLGQAQVQRVFRDMASKRRVSRQLHRRALLIQPVDLAPEEQ